jgi:hypothetical protein
MQDLTNSFQLRYDHLAAQLTSEQIENFRRGIEEAHCGLDLWDASNSDNDASGTGACTMQSIQDFLQPETSEESPLFSFPGDAV